MLTGNLCSFFRSTPARQRVIPGEEASFLPLWKHCFFHSSLLLEEKKNKKKTLLQASSVCFGFSWMTGNCGTTSCPRQSFTVQLILQDWNSGNLLKTLSWKSTASGSPATAGNPPVCLCIIKIVVHNSKDTPMKEKMLSSR